ncbi:hypothetical protein BDZ88DRAFT_438774 [Geranomyces variabilis]|nr:hypothetical protein BDZ88DRAFT_438774 [Geranomyces variabilis]
MRFTPPASTRSTLLVPLIPVFSGWFGPVSLFKLLARFNFSTVVGGLWEIECSLDESWNAANHSFDHQLYTVVRSIPLELPDADFPAFLNLAVSALAGPTLQVPSDSTYAALHKDLRLASGVASFEALYVEFAYDNGFACPILMAPIPVLTNAGNIKNDTVRTTLFTRLGVAPELRSLYRISSRHLVQDREEILNYLSCTLQWLNGLILHEDSSEFNGPELEDGTSWDLLKLMKKKAVGICEGVLTAGASHAVILDIHSTDEHARIRIVLNDIDEHSPEDPAINGSWGCWILFPRGARENIVGRMWFPRFSSPLFT